VNAVCGWRRNAFGMALIVAAAAWSAPDAERWNPVSVPDADMQAEDVKAWQAYRGAELSKVAGPAPGRRVLRVAVPANRYGGLRIEVTPRGGFGSRVRITLRYRVVSGKPVTVHAGPNTWNQIAAVLTSRDWETATMEAGLVSDYHLVLHVAQPAPDGVFEVAALTVRAAPAAPGVRERLGPVDVAVQAVVPDNPAACLDLMGAPPASVTLAEESDAAEVVYRIATAPQARPGQAALRQGLGHLPAGTHIRFECRCRAAPGARIVAGLGPKQKAAVTQTLTAQADDANLTVDWTQTADGVPYWRVGPAGSDAAEFSLSRVHAWVRLPDPTGKAAMELPEKRTPITFSSGDAKTVYIHPPWPGFPRIKCHLEYTSRWSFKFPTSHHFDVSAQQTGLKLDWQFQEDPVRYTVSLNADRPDSFLVEARVRNGGNAPVKAFRPGFCLQLSGAHSPKTFAYTIIPRGRQPLRLDLASPLRERPPLWPGIGWVRAHKEGSLPHKERLAGSQEWKPPRALVNDVGDFPLLARRIPGRNAWIAWIWPVVQEYFGNTACPCMHMDPILPDCPPGQSRAMFGRMVFFEGAWDELYSLAEREREDLAQRTNAAR